MSFVYDFCKSRIQMLPTRNTLSLVLDAAVLSSSFAKAQIRQAPASADGCGLEASVSLDILTEFSRLVMHEANILKVIKSIYTIPVLTVLTSGVR